MGDVMEDHEQRPLHGMTVIGNKSNGVWSYTLAAEEPTEEQLDELNKLAEQLKVGELMLPDHAVKVGEKWSLDPSVIAIAMAMEFEEFELISGEGYNELKAITEYQGRECAHLLLSVNLKATYIDETMGGLSDIVLTVKGETYRALDTFVDLYSEGEGTMNISRRESDDGMKMNMTGSFKTTETVSGL
jgi:hypothetical protein